MNDCNATQKRLYMDRIILNCLIASWSRKNLPYVLIKIHTRVIEFEKKMNKVFLDVPISYEEAQLIYLFVPDLPDYCIMTGE